MQIFLDILEAVGVVSFAATGAIAAIDREVDLFGVLFLSVVTAFGGGAMRDVMLGYTPTFFGAYFLMTLCLFSALAVFIAAAIFKNRYVRHEREVEGINNYFDAMGLGIFSVMGAEICVSSGRCTALAVITLGMITGIGGGIIRDICLREIPFVLKKRVYAVASLLGTSLYYALLRLTPLPEYVPIMLGILTVFGVRMLATALKLDIPKAIIFDKTNSQK